MRMLIVTDSNVSWSLHWSILILILFHVLLNIMLLIWILWLLWQIHYDWYYITTAILVHMFHG